MKNRIKQLITCALVVFVGTVLLSAESKHSESNQPLDDLVAIQTALAGDTMAHVSHHAAAISKAASEHKLHGLSADVASQAAKVAESKNLKAARHWFKPLSKSFVDYLSAHPDKSGKYNVAYCPMAKASWIQKGATIRNPYFGKSMLNCGTIKK